MNDPTEDEALTLACIQHALDDAWQDGKRRLRLKRVMQERIDRARRQTGYQTLEAMRRGDAELYNRFLAGCKRAMVRDQLIEAGQLGQSELQRMRENLETKDLHDAFDDIDPTAARYG